MQKAVATAGFKDVIVALMDDLLATIIGDSPVYDIRVGPFVTAVLSRNAGLAATVIPAHVPHGTPAMPGAGALPRSSARYLAELARTENSLQRSVGVATLNSMLTIDDRRCVEINAGDLLIDKGKDKRVALIGHFPFASRLRQTARHLDVLELHPDSEDVAAEMAPELVPQADIVAITGSALVNGTIESLLALCRPTSTVMVLGPSTPLSPVWFEHGVHIVSGAQVVQADAALRSVSEGAIFRQVRGVRLLTLMRDR